MASSYTTNYGIEKIGSGEQAGAWGTTTNHNLDIMDRIASFKSVALSGTTHTLTVREASPGSGTENLQDGMFRVIKFTGALGANNTVTIAPNTTTAYFIFINATTDSGSSGPYSVVLTQGSGANITIPNGDTKVVFCDGAGSGAAVVDAFASLSVVDLKVQDDLTVTDDASVGGDLAVTGGLDVSGTIKLDGNYPTGTSNVALGDTALDSVQAGGTHNTAIGATTGTAITTGDQNTLIGSAAGDAIVTVNDNTAVGYNALTVATTANNTAIGSGALAAYAASSGAGSTAVGFGAATTVTANPITAVGTEAGGFQTGASNTFLGTSAGKGTGSSTADQNTGIGHSTHAVLETGATANTAVGAFAGDAITTGDDNVTIGRNSGTSINTGQNNTLVGSFSGNTTTTATNLTAIGHNAGYTGTAATQCVFVGAQAGYETTGSNNTFVGYQAGYYNTSPVSNTAFGYQAGFGNSSSKTTGNHNHSVGYQAGYSLTSGNNNVSFGTQANFALNSGSSNVTVGYQAGYSGGGGVASTTASNNILIGQGAMASVGDATHQIVIASQNGLGKGNSTGFIAPSTGGVFQGNNSANWSTTSDRRIKKNIEDNKTGLSAIEKIKVRNFEYRKPEEVDPELAPTDAIEKEGTQVGVIAQEIKDVLPDVVTTQSTGCMSVQPDNITWYLVNAVKELSAKVKELEEKCEC
tara:strand:- start:142 stop:2226 length:2085 start_codon:yes stop_codon:yes gene_type:complete